MMDFSIFVLLPYAGIVLCLAGIVRRNRSSQLTWSTYSTLMLEQPTLRFGAIAWHFGILLLLAGHLAGFLFPGVFETLFRNGSVRLWTESVVLALGMLALIGLCAFILRRLFLIPSLFSLPVEWILMALLLVQVCSGVYMGIFHRFGIQWYLYTVVPWLKSLLLFHPQIATVADLPVAFKLHVSAAFLLIAVLPYTKLVHLLFFPLRFLIEPRIHYRWKVDPDRKMND